MKISIPAASPDAPANPWRTVLEFQVGSGPNLVETGRHRDPSLVFGLASGVAIGLALGVLFFFFLYWLTQ